MRTIDWLDWHFCYRNGYLPSDENDSMCGCARFSAVCSKANIALVGLDLLSSSNAYCSGLQMCDWTMRTTRWEFSLSWLFVVHLLLLLMLHFYYKHFYLWNWHCFVRCFSVKSRTNTMWLMMKRSKRMILLLAYDSIGFVLLSSLPVFAQLLFLIGNEFVCVFFCFLVRFYCSNVTRVPCKSFTTRKCHSNRHFHEIFFFLFFALFVSLLILFSNRFSLCELWNLNVAIFFFGNVEQERKFDKDDNDKQRKRIVDCCLIKRTGFIHIKDKFCSWNKKPKKLKPNNKSMSY